MNASAGSSSPQPSRNLSRKLAISLSILCVGLLGEVLLLALYRPASAVDWETLRIDPRVRAEVLERLAAETRGIHDSFSDPLVGRVLLPQLNGIPFRDAAVSSNSRGLREKEYQVPKPLGKIRIVLLGDSFVFGTGIESEDRCGVFLERFLRERMQAAIDAENVECLHLGLPSWNLVAECAFLRRQLSFLQPDLVFHISVPNDLDDCSGVKGWGGFSKFSPQRRERADSTITMYFPQWLGFKVPGFLPEGLDYESQHRLRDCAQRIEHLAQEVRRAGGKYVFVNNWSVQATVAERHLTASLPPGEVAYVARSLTMDSRFRVSDEDHHWSRAGCERVAKMLYGLAVERQLLPSLAPAPWPEAAKEVDLIHREGEKLAKQSVEPRVSKRRKAQITRKADFLRYDERLAAQVHGGIDAERFVSPYASVILRKGKGTKLSVRAQSLPVIDLDGATVRVFVDRFRVGTITLGFNIPLSLDVPLPKELARREFVSVRFEAEDFIYHPLNPQHCIAFQIAEIAITD